MPKKVPRNKARQGRRGFPVLFILIVGLLLAALAWWGAEIYGVAIAPNEPAGDLQTPQ
ncbi:hypothetical protein [Chelativorans salis]|uniref:Uncharacterized protein n=1 Tax=Chelativorans salis TaxID=2978478 RepID=A0ABT2LSC0_9HYPH|nr:hypothetical protein [Chelativorans sp. EGI FJ00035]MCT7377430.1 hypothetical protein [Chelativorans sp. EGI FJ00035]